MTVRRTGLLAGFASLTALRLVSAALSFGLVVWLARALGPSALGTFSLVMAVFVLLQYLPALGLQVAISRNVASAPSEAGRQLVNGLLLSLPMTALTVVTVATYALRVTPVDDPGMRAGLLAVAGALVPTAFTTIVEAVLLGHERSSRVAMVGLVEASGRTVASLAALRLGCGIETLFLLFVAGRVLAALAYWWSAEVRVLVRREYVDGATVRALTARAPVFFGIMILAQLMDRMDFLLLGSLGNVQEVGIYAAPYKIYELLLMVPRIASLLLLPRFAACFESRPRDLDALIQSTLRVGVSVAVPVVLLASFFASDLMRLFGREYETGAPLFLLLCLAVVGVALNNLLSIVMIVTGKQRLDLVTLIICTLVYGLSLSLLIPRHGAWGAAVATLLIAFVQPLIAAVFLRKQIAVLSATSSLARVVVGGGAMAVVTWLATPFQPVLGALVGLVVYAGVLFALRIPSTDDLRCLDVALRPRHVA